MMCSLTNEEKGRAEAYFDSLGGVGYFYLCKDDISEVLLVQNVDTNGIHYGGMGQDYFIGILEKYLKKHGAPIITEEEADVFNFPWK